MRITKDTIYLKKKLESSRKEYLAKMIGMRFLNGYNSLSNEEKITARYLEGKIDAIDDTLHIMNRY